MLIDYAHCNTTPVASVTLDKTKKFEENEKVCKALTEKNLRIVEVSIVKK